ncbi:hypothetical protein BGZ73_005015 [Actinomortierella ambigua]|nr:hypothetical protein BGZ73_005015 [Actinomortierella ambigua]
MLGSDSGSSDLSEVDASSSSSSEEDMTLDHRIPNKKNPSPLQPLQNRTSNIPPNLTPPKKRLPQSAAIFRASLPAPSASSPFSSTAPSTTSGKKNFSKKYTSQVGTPASVSSFLSSSGSDSDSLGSDLSDSDGAESVATVKSQKSRGKRLPAKSSPSVHEPSLVVPKGAPISLTDSQPVYSQEIMDGTLNKNTSLAKSHKSDAATSSSRGGKKGGRAGRGLLSGSTSAKGGVSKAIVIDFDEDEGEDDEQYVSLGSNSPASLPPILAHSTPTTSSSKVTSKTEKKLKAASKTKEKKKRTKKGGQPSSKQADQEVYCICRGTYDGSEFMIACDRCEEWFHGRCIGVKPQAAKKTTHFYCQNCLAAMNQPPPPPPTSAAEHQKEKPKKQKSKSKDKEKDKDKKKSKKKKKKSKEREDLDDDSRSISKHGSLHGALRQTYNPEAEEQEIVAVESSEDEITLPTGHRTASTVYPSQAYEQHLSSPLQQSSQFDPTFSEWQTQKQHRPHPILSTKTPAAKQPAFAPQPIFENSSQAPLYAPPPAPPTSRFAPVTQSMDDEDEDVCPVCEFECTCGPPAAANAPSPALPVPSSAFAAKAPMPPPQSHLPHHLGQESASVGLSFQESSAESFQSAFKSPMATPSGVSLRRPSFSHRGGKGLGKAPVLLQAVKSQTYKSSHGKTLKSSKAMQYYRHLLSSSGSDEGGSDIGSEDEMEDIGDVHVSYKKSHVFPKSTLADGRDAQETIGDGEEEENEDEDNAALAIDSSSSLSDLDDTINDYDSAGESPSKPAASAVNSTKGSKWIAKDVGQVSSPMLGPSTLNATSPPPVTSKRGSSRPKKRKDSLGLTREDEDQFYMPAVASSSHRATSNVSKAHGRSPSKKDNKARREPHGDTLASKPPPVKNQDEARSHKEATKHEAELSSDEYDMEDDIFGDGELSDAPSDDYFDGDLSDDIEAFDDFDDDGDEMSQMFDTSDDLESTSSGAREYHYSDLEEEDEESLVDSDSSLNTSSQSDSDNGSETSTDSEIEPPQPLGSPDEDVVAYDDDELDEDELLRLAEEERRIVQRAHLLQEYLSEEEEADPDRNPFESSEEEDSSADEYEFDADGEGYEDDYYDDEEDDYFDEGLDHLNLVYDEYKGSKLEMQALMMIPPEQQEQLLLLQHYAEQQQQKLQQQQELLEREQAQSRALSAPDIDHAAIPPIAGTQDGAFLMTVPDLDAVSEQLALSLATSMASSLAGSMSEASPPEDANTMTASLPSSVPSTPTLSTFGQVALAVPMTASENVPSLISASEHISSVIPTLSPDATTSTSATPTSTIMPTPANTPTPPSGSEATPKEVEAPSTSITASEEQSSFMEQSTSPACTPQAETTSVGLAATTPTSTLSSQEILESLDAATAQLLAKTLEQSSQGFHVLEEASGEPPQDIPAALLSTLAIHKRKGDLLGGKNAGNESKRRRTSLSATVVDPGLLPDMAALMDIGAGTVSDLARSPKVSNISETRSALTDLLTSTSPAELTPGLISLASTTKLDPTHVQGRRGSMRSSKGRRFSKSEPQNSASAAVEPMPMDDLLDTSALYGEHADEEEPAGIPQTVSRDLSRWEKVPIGTFRRSRRPSSPYIGLQGAIKSGRQDIESALLSAAHPNHTEASLRGSGSHPSTPSSGAARDALRRIQRGSVGMRRYRSNPASLSGSDLQTIVHQQQGLKGHEIASLSGKGKSPAIQHLLSASHLPHIAAGGSGAHVLPEAFIAMMGNTPPSVHVGMLMEELTNLGSPKDLSTTALPLLGSSSSSSSKLTSSSAKLPAAGLVRSAHTDDLFSQDSRYHSLSTGASSRRRRMAKSLSQNSVRGFRASSHSGLPSLSSRQRGGVQHSSQEGLVAGLGIDIIQAGPSSLNRHERRRKSEGAAVTGGGEGPARTEDVMTDVSQLPSSACPTPLHSPLFSATDAAASSNVVEDVPKDTVIPPLNLDPSGFAKIPSLLSTLSSSSSGSVAPSSSSGAATVQLNLRRSTVDDDEEIDIDDDTDVDAIWRATFGYAEETTGKAQQA